MELWTDVHLVGSGRMGFDLTDPFDCHVYLVGDGSSWALIDAGAGIDVEPIIAQISTVVDLDRIEALILTHKHADHAGGAAQLSQRLGLRVIASAHTAEVIAGPDEDRLGLVDARSAGVYPSDYIFEACQVDDIVEDGDIVKIGSLALRAIETPGHCEGHLSFVGTLSGRPTLLTGDALFHGGRVVWQTTYDCSVQEHVSSIRRLANETFDAFLPGHFAFSLSGGKRHVEAALQRIARMDVPAHVV